jgi:hypothetical protein
LRVKSSHDICRLGTLAHVRRCDHQCTVEPRTRNDREVRGRRRAGGNQPEIVATVARLPENQARLPVVATDKDYIDASGLHLRNQR